MLTRSRVVRQIDVREPQRIAALMGSSAYVQHLASQIERVARTNFTVIVQGATGTGKELVARFIHAYSQRASKPFIAVDCGALPESIVESELFGYVKGAFTGAHEDKPGYFHMARGGTLFLDEIANLPPVIQMKLLRTLQEGTIVPLGSGKSVRTDVRIIVASNAVLEEEVRAGRFRCDLFYRLNEFKLYLVPLRQRREDIVFLAEHFRRETNAELGKRVRGFTAEAQAWMLAYEWPGNVRELRNAVRRAVLLSNEIIELQHVHKGSAPWSDPLPMSPTLPIDKMRQGHGLHEMLREATADLERTLILRMLQQTQGNKLLTARRLQIGYKTLFRKLKDYNIH
jgi:two-component system, NtrC family, response regulator HydG